MRHPCQACTGGHVELVALLLEHGASVGHATPIGRTAVIMASLQLCCKQPSLPRTGAGSETPASFRGMGTRKW